MTGRVVADGVRSGGIDPKVGNAIVNDLDSSTTATSLGELTIRDNVSPYGCNMAFRSKAIENLWFDERLSLFGWLEDRDFGFRVASRARRVSADFIWGVHLGLRSGRVSGLRFGYSQVVNPWYLMTKGVVKPTELCKQILLGLSPISSVQYSGTRISIVMVA